MIEGGVEAFDLALPDRLRLLRDRAARDLLLDRRALSAHERGRALAERAREYHPSDLQAHPGPARVVVLAGVQARHDVVDLLAARARPGRARPGHDVRQVEVERDEF